MLTEQEKKWLEKRNFRCSYCIHYKGGIEGICFWCPDRKKFETSAYSLVPDYRDAAEFEARVAERVAIMAQNFQLIHAIGYAVPNVSWFLKQARIAVEQEMEEVCLKN